MFIAVALNENCEFGNQSSFADNFRQSAQVFPPKDRLVPLSKECAHECQMNSSERYENMRQLQYNNEKVRRALFEPILN